MKKYFSLMILLVFTGCSYQPKIIVPTISNIPSTQFTWTDEVVDGNKVHILSESEWTNVKLELINRRISGNICIDVLNKISSD